MRHRLPSLNALRAFEAAARHGSVTAAARELTVTPGAVSRQVALLESHFACRLFERHRRGLSLTEKGRRYFASISDAFDRIDAASTHLGGHGGKHRLSVRVFTTFATEWLLPRLTDFRTRHPWIDFRLNASLQTVDFNADDVDMGVLAGPSDWPALRWDALFSPRFFPVCSPALLEREPRLETPQDLRHHTLLYSSIQVPNWRAWLAGAQVNGIDPERGLWFENSSLTYHAAREGVGVALGQRLFLTDDLVSGRLVAPFELTLTLDRTYYLVCPAQRAEEPSIAAFRAWIIEEVRKTETRAEELLPRLGANTLSIVGADRLDYHRP
jgi:LysR family transcriptional regulator, glycine cleavage system transcriptional activator